MKKHFDCGHFGKGTFCHRCDQAATLTAAAKNETDATKLLVLKQKAEKLYAVPKRAGTTMMPSTPVPT